MSWWNLGGLNPHYKDFVEKHPDKTMIGLMWSLQWRFMVLVLLAEAVFIGGALFIGFIVR
jgi:hypothetical protein